MPRNRREGEGKADKLANTKKQFNDASVGSLVQTTCGNGKGYLAKLALSLSSGGATKSGVGICMYMHIYIHNQSPAQTTE